MAPAGPSKHSKHISFEDPPAGSSDEEDRNAVEVLLNPSNPYRRKSSLVTADSVLPHLPRGGPQQSSHSNRTECLVHQFLDHQRRVAATRSAAASATAAATAATTPTADTGGDGPSTSTTTTKRKRRRSRCDIIDIDSNSNSNSNTTTTPPSNDDDNNVSTTTTSTKTIGQADEKSWKAEIQKSTSELDLSNYADETCSRLLTKKQLSEMAWGVRELSRRLGSVRLRFRVKTIFLLTKTHDQELVPKTRELVRWLLLSKVGYTVYVNQELRGSRGFDARGLVEGVRREREKGSGDGSGDDDEVDDVEKRLRYWDEQICRTRPHTFDFVITLGGDGTVLYASWLFQRIVPPVLSFALGSLGFLTKFDFEDHRRILTNAFTEGVSVSLRLRFEGTVMRKNGQDRGEDEVDEAEEEEQLHRSRDLVEELIGEEKDDEHTHRPDGTYEVLNEVVVDRGPNPSKFSASGFVYIHTQITAMSLTEIFGDDEHFTSVMADGVCVSTPTGSTAYNLAAGGSLCHPENPVMLVTAICAHTLSFRPIIVPDTIVLRIGVPYNARTGSWASFDGRERIELRPGDYVTISASRYPFASVQTPGRRSEDWINSISAKLGWNTRQKQKLGEGEGEGEGSRRGARDEVRWMRYCLVYE
ncbi:ATP-NAD kinase-like domain-containing protein [Bombardia bombarda]|uniref:ATP-NAD kinase-like domain-containing protein n=1 Tax=Bombardia bombarda TaxID=252184 RepID=A0AA40BW80_9PEZI|nr:ATP-NAD kinase-like domain-containing protein [Bombardia bombarda]